MRINEQDRTTGSAAMSASEAMSAYGELRHSLVEVVRELVHPQHGCERLSDGRWAMSADDMHQLRSLLSAMKRAEAAAS